MLNYNTDDLTMKKIKDIKHQNIMPAFVNAEFITVTDNKPIKIEIL